jgi:cytochrome c oxidase subunit 1
MSTPSYLHQQGLLSWFLTLDHKRIAVLYMVTVTFFFFAGGLAATLIRIELVTPQGDLLSADGYNRAFTLHGVIMVWFFLIPSIPSVFGNFLVPIMIGARDMAVGTCCSAVGCSRCWRCCSAGSIPAGPSTRRCRRCSATATWWR